MFTSLANAKSKTTKVKLGFAGTINQYKWTFQLEYKISNKAPTKHTVTVRFS